LPTFRIADPINDEALNTSARATAERMLASDPALERKENAGVRQLLTVNYARALELFRVG
jgi:hypothetical protein